MTKIICGLFLCLVCLLPVQSFAQSVPDQARAGAAVRTFAEKEAELRLQEELLPLVSSQQSGPELVATADARLAVREFLFRGNTVFSSRRLLGILSAYSGRELSFGELQEACRALTVFYRKAGYFLAYAFLPVQDIKDGVVLIEIAEGRVGSVTVEGARYYSPDFVRTHFRVGSGDIANYQELLKSLLLLNEYRDLDVKARFLKGQQPYTVDVVLKVQDKRTFHGLADYNNFGSRYIAKNRSGLMLEHTNVLLPGARLSMRAVAGSPLRNVFFGRMAYNLPLNSHGTKAELSWLRSDFNVQKEYRDLDAGGRTKIYSLTFTHPLRRTHLTSADLNFGFDHKTIQDYLLGSVNSRDDLRVFRTGLDYDHKDSLRGRNAVSALLSYGVADIWGGSARNDDLSSRQGAGGEFLKTNMDLSRFQQFIGESYLVMRASGQVASDVLPVSEQFALGGPDSVRGFSQSEYLGDLGLSSGLELRFLPPFLASRTVPFTRRAFNDFLQFLTFVDYGQAYLKNPVAGENKNYELTGAGAGLRMQFTSYFNVRMDVGFPLSGREPSQDNDPVLYVQGVSRF